MQNFISINKFRLYFSHSQKQPKLCESMHTMLAFKPLEIYQVNKYTYNISFETVASPLYIYCIRICMDLLLISGGKIK